MGEGMERRSRGELVRGGLREEQRTEECENQIYLIRDRKVMLDTDVAAMYEVDTRHLIQVVRRHPERFPVDFVFRLTPQEFDMLREQLDHLSDEQPRTMERNYSTPYAFTEEGVVMVAHYLKSPRAIHVGNTVVQDFIRMRRMCGSTMEISHKLIAMEERYDTQFREVFQALKSLESVAKPSPTRQVGFRV